MTTELMDGSAHPDRSEYTDAQQLDHYKVHPLAFGEVTSLLDQLGKLLAMWGVATAAIWAVLIPNSFHLSRWPLLTIYAFHAVVSLIVAQYVNGISRTMVQRLDFLNLLAGRYYPEIQKLGRLSRQNLGRRSRTGRWWRLLEPKWLWALIPVLAFLCDGALVGMSILKETQTRTVCQASLDRLLAANSRYEVERAIYVLNRAECSLTEDTELARKLSVGAK